MKTSFLAASKGESRADASIYLMPPPNGVNDLPAFEALKVLAAVTGGTIRFRTGSYKSPSGFRLSGFQGVTLQGTGATLNGLHCTILINTGPRTLFSAVVTFLECVNCFVEDLGVLAIFGGCEYGVLIIGGVTDSVLCGVHNVHVYGNAAATKNTTSVTSVNLSTAVNVNTAITLVSAAGSYVAGTRLLVASRSGNGFMHGEVVSLVGNVLTFTPRDVFGTATLADWDIVQSMDAFNFASTEACAIDFCEATLCYNSFRLNGVGGIVGPNNLTSSPLGPSFRVDGSSSGIKLFGEAENNVRYLWTVAVYVTGAVNLEVSVGLGDDHHSGVPYVFRSVRGGFFHNLNAQCTSALGVYVMSLISCTGVTIDTVIGSIASGAFINNISANSNCRATNLNTLATPMVTFGSANFAGFVEWDDVATNFLNANFLSVQFLTSRFGGKIPSVVMTLANGATVNRALSSGFQVISGPTAAFSISGFAPPDDGKRISFVYLGTQILTLTHLGAGSTAANQLMCPTGADIVLVAPAGGFVYFDILYSSSAGKWLVILPK